MIIGSGERHGHGYCGCAPVDLANAPLTNPVSAFPLDPHDGIRLTALAEPALLTKQSMGYLVDDLEAHGYVERVPDPTDRRAKVVRLTARGREVEETVRAVIHQLEAEWAARLGEDDYAHLLRLLRTLITVLGD